jgi:hypothetical protein
MIPGISLKELLTWSSEAGTFWKAHFDAHPKLLQLQCGIDSSADIQEFVRHIWVAELHWARCVAAMTMVPRSDHPAGPFEVLYGLHLRAHEIFQGFLDNPSWNWDQTVELPYEWLPSRLRTASRRKLAGHALLHSQRHWAQLATHLRTAGFPSDFQGDLIFSYALG